MACALSLLLAMVTLFLPLAEATEADGSQNLPIVLGMSTALTGPAAALGVNMKAGVEAAVSEVNRSGGIHGRIFQLIALDDGYEPSRTAPNMRTLVEDKGVLAVIGNVGTPTAVAAIPIANNSRTPFFGAFTGAGILRKKPPDRYIINYRASYAEETTAMVDALLQYGGLEPEEIGFFTQRDAYGDAGFSGGIAALKRHGLKDENKIVHGRYERNTVAVENALADIILAEPIPRAIIMVGAYTPCAAFALLAKESPLDALLLNVSFVGAEQLARQLGNDGEGIIVTQVVPHFDSDLPIVHDYKKAIAAWDDSIELSCGSLEGYIAARIFFLATGKIQGAITREAVITSLEGLDTFDIGLGTPLKLGPDKHQASHSVWPTVIKKGKLVPFYWKELRAIFARR
jgi:ABC-type branched-subunit amino acid transport system substrate-binding protein